MYYLEAVDVILNLLVPELAVTLVERVNLACLGDLHIVVSEDKLANHGVECEPVDSSSHAQHEDRGGAVEAVTSTGKVLSWLADVDDTLLDELVGVVVCVQGALLARLINTPDGSNGNTGFVS